MSLLQACPFYNRVPSISVSPVQACPLRKRVPFSSVSHLHACPLFKCVPFASVPLSNAQIVFFLSHLLRSSVAACDHNCDSLLRCLLRYSWDVCQNGVVVINPTRTRARCNGVVCDERPLKYTRSAHVR